MQAHFGNEAAQILQGTADSSLGGDEAEELEELLTGFIIDHGEQIACFEGWGTTSTSSQEAMAYLEANHPEAHHIIQTQSKELECLLGKDQAAMALGQKREPFYIEVLCWNDLCVVTADEFDNEWFNNKEMAIASAEESYEPFIRNSSNQKNSSIGSDERE